MGDCQSQAAVPSASGLDDAKPEDVKPIEKAPEAAATSPFARALTRARTRALFPSAFGTGIMASPWYSIPRPLDTANLTSWQAEPRWYDSVPFPLRHATRADRVSTLCFQPKAGSTFFKQLLGTVLRPTVGGQCAKIDCARLPYATPPPPVEKTCPMS